MDQYYNNVQFALSLNGDLSDWSKYHRISKIDAGITMSSNIVKYGSYSLYFTPGSSKSLVIDYLNWDSNTADYTLEFWAYAVKSGSPAIVFLSGQYRDNTNYWKLYLNSTNDSIGLISSNGTSISFSSGYVGKWDKWTHIAVTRSGNNTTIFIDGVISCSGTVTFSAFTDMMLFGGIQHSGTSEFLNGYLSDIRFTQGVCRYSANFTLPATLLENSNLRAITLQAYDSISGNALVCNFDVSCADGLVKSYVSNAGGNYTVKIPDGISVEIAAYATGYKKARVESAYHPNIVRLDLKRDIVSNSPNILQLSPLVYYPGDDDPVDRMLNSGVAGGYSTIYNQNYLQRFNDSGSRVNGKPYYKISATGTTQVFGTSTGMAGLTSPTYGLQLVTNSGGTMCGWVNPIGTISLYNESTSGLNYSDQRFIIATIGAGSDNGYGISVGTNGVQVYIHRDSTICPVLSWAGSVIGWNHIAIVLNVAGNPSLYLNGMLVRTTNFIPPGGRYIGLWFGSDWSNSLGSYTGSFAEFCMFGKPLTKDDIMRVINGYSSFKIQGQVLDSSGYVKKCFVRAYSHETGKLMGECTTDSLGYYSLIVGEQILCYVVCSPTEFNDISSNAVIYSNIIPTV